ncbi:hypothetical protein M0811_11661 [Anaeramoeba ignava]|uniref:MARVEL domain-containing protein n=1 Tax=Anaeramoeba ignava TaxID=1746090 RepID=A0A9Q0LAU5_ANAIG|nr:hypothetical protein M0811_11661 [Anaeramoeba ignava]
MHSTILKIIFIESFIFIIIIFIWVFFNFVFFPDDSLERITTITSTIIFGFGMAIPCITVSIQDKNCPDFTNFFTWVIVFNIFWILFCFLFPLSIIYEFYNPEELRPLGVFLNILIFLFLFAWSIYGWVKYTSWGSSDSSCTHFSNILLSESIICSICWFFSCISISLVLENIG